MGTAQRYDSSFYKYYSSVVAINFSNKKLYSGQYGGNINVSRTYFVIHLASRNMVEKGTDNCSTNFPLCEAMPSSSGAETK